MQIVMQFFKIIICKFDAKQKHLFNWYRFCFLTTRLAEFPVMHLDRVGPAEQRWRTLTNSTVMRRRYDPID